jgi:hypothetical protein
MPCPSCGGTDHQRSSNKLCGNRKIPWKDVRPSCKSDIVRGYEPAPHGLYHTIRSYKCGFQTVLISNPVTTDLKLNIERHVHHFSWVAFESSRLLQLHLQRILEKELPIPDFTNRTWMQKCFDIHHKVVDDVQLQSSFQLYKECRGTFTPYFTLEGMVPQIKTYFVKDYVTVLQTHLKTQFWIVAKRSIACTYEAKGLPFKNAWKVACYIVEIAKDSCKDDNEETDENEDPQVEVELRLTDDTQDVDEVVEEHYQEFVEIANDLITTYSAGLESILRYNYHHNKKVMERGRKLSSLVPLYSTEAKYITIDTTALYWLLGGKRGTGKTAAEFLEEGIEEWKKILNLSSGHTVHASRKRFEMIFHTDGVGCTIKLRKWKPKQEDMDASEKKKQQIQFAKDRLEQEIARIENIHDDDCNFVGIDPGRKRFAMVVKQHASRGSFASNNEEIVLNISNGRYYHECKMKYRRRRVDLWMKDMTCTNEGGVVIGVSNWWKEQPSAKGGFCYNTMQNLRYIFSGPLQKVVELKQSKKCRKLRWKVYMHTQKTLSRFCSDRLGGMDETKHTVIAYGDGKFNTNSKGHAPLPRNDKLLELLRKHKHRAKMKRLYNVTVLNIWEFNTSQVCSTCHSFDGLDGCETATNSHFVRRCQNPSCRMIWDRDVNACRNMIYLGKLLKNRMERPELFRRSLKKLRLNPVM